MHRHWRSNNRLLYFLLILRQEIGCALQLQLSTKSMKNKKVILSLIKAQENMKLTEYAANQAEFIFLPYVYFSVCCY